MVIPKTSRNNAFNKQFSWQKLAFVKQEQRTLKQEQLKQPSNHKVINIINAPLTK